MVTILQTNHLTTHLHVPPTDSTVHRAECTDPCALLRSWTGMSHEMEIVLLILRMLAACMALIAVAQPWVVYDLTMHTSNALWFV